jgi:hypothetical protein
MKLNFEFKVFHNLLTMFGSLKLNDSKFIIFYFTSSLTHFWILALDDQIITRQGLPKNIK